MSVNSVWSCYWPGILRGRPWERREVYLTLEVLVEISFVPNSSPTKA